MIFSDKILTPRLCLRRMKENDIPLLVDWSNSVIAHGDYLTPDCMDDQTTRAGLSSGAFWGLENRLFLIELKGQEPIGTLRYWLRSEQKNCGVIALKISEPEERGKGYGTEAQKYIITQLFQRLKLQFVEMYTDINNKPQQRCLTKLGFELVDTLNYDDHQVRRIGHLYRIDFDTFTRLPVYHYHYEE